MIKNVVFDLGGVLVDFIPLQYLDRLKFDNATKNKLNEIIFKSKDWNEYDRGIYLHNTDIAEKIIKEHPDLEEEIKLVLQDNWVKMHVLREDTVNYLKQLKLQGMNIYILSNLSKDTYNYVTKFDFFSFIDGGVYSFDVNICKPDEGIYKILLEKYNLHPKETAFFDDRLDNIEAAKNLGIQGIQFTSLDEAKLQLENLKN